MEAMYNLCGNQQTPANWGASQGVPASFGNPAASGGYAQQDLNQMWASQQGGGSYNGGGKQFGGGYGGKGGADGFGGASQFGAGATGQGNCFGCKGNAPGGTTGAGGNFNAGCYGGGCRGGFRGNMPGGEFSGMAGYDEDGYYPRYSQGTGPVYAQDMLGEYTIHGESQVTVQGKQGEAVPQAMTTFELCDQVFPPVIMMQLRAAGFTEPTPVQATTWPVAIQGRDVIGVAKTGSGKTLAYLLPGFMRIINGQVQGRGPHLLVLSPTRELARQIEQEGEKFGQIRTACLYGGAPRGQQLGQLRRGSQLLVATPGRLNDFLEGGQVNLSNTRYCVLDEADRMLDMGFEPQIRTILKRTPTPRQTLLYTATWPKEVRSLASEFLTSPISVNVGRQALVANEDVQQNVIIVQNDQQKLEELRKILEMCVQGDLVLVFCATKMGCAWLGQHLFSQYRIPCVALHGDLAQQDRDYAIDSFKKGRKPILVGTDVAARGLDIKGIKCVINFDPPSGSEEYVHRIGRTGRAGEKGYAYSFLGTRDSKKARDIVKVMEAGNVAIPPELASLAGTCRSGAPRKGKGKGKGPGKGKGSGGKKGGKGKGGGFSGPKGGAPSVSYTGASRPLSSPGA